MHDMNPTPLPPARRSLLFAARIGLVLKSPRGWERVFFPRATEATRSRECVAEVVVWREGENVSMSSEKSKKGQKVAKKRGGLGTGYAVYRQNKGQEKEKQGKGVK